MSLTKAQRDHRNRRREWLNDMKSVPCADCDQTFPPICMDFDHIEEKSFDIAYAVVTSRRWSDILEEVEKCELVCANCHRIRTQQRQKKGGK
jgi:hypothetical protein